MLTENNTPLVSFCLFAYNQQEFIAEAVKGAFSQTYPNLEIIISDDCSKDNTFEIITDLAKKYSGNHKVILNRNEQNLGLAAHVNKVFSMAAGDIFVGAAGDDISLPNRTEVFIKAFQKDENIVSVSCNLTGIDSIGNKFVENSCQRNNEVYDINDYLNREDFHVNGASRAIRRNLFQQFGKLNTKCPTEDTPYLLRAFMSGKVLLLAEKLVLYRTHENNLSGENNIYKMSINEIYRQYKKDINLAIKLKFISSGDAKDLFVKIKKNKNIRKGSKRKNVLLKIKQKLRNIIFPSEKNEINLFWYDEPDLRNFGDILAPYIISRIYDVKIIDVRNQIKKHSFIDKIYRFIFRILNLGIKFINVIKRNKFNLLLYKRKVVNRTFENFIFRNIYHIINIFRSKREMLLYKPVYLTVGSIIRFSKPNNAVWGSGIMNKNDIIKGGRFYAVRGFKTIERLKQLNLQYPSVVGDPALLLPLIYKPSNPKKYKLGIIPHFVDYEYVKNNFSTNDILIIDLLNGNIEETINQIYSCEYTVSSSLHGLIVSHAYKIPSIWCKISDKLQGDDIKFYDYFSSVKIPEYLNFSEDLLYFSIEEIIRIINENYINANININLVALQEKLICVIPLKKKFFFK